MLANCASQGSNDAVFFPFTGHVFLPSSMYLSLLRFNTDLIPIMRNVLYPKYFQGRFCIGTRAGAGTWQISSRLPHTRLLQCPVETLLSKLSFRSWCRCLRQRYAHLRGWQT